MFKSDYRLKPCQSNNNSDRSVCILERSIQHAHSECTFQSMSCLPCIIYAVVSMVMCWIFMKWQECCYLHLFSFPWCAENEPPHPQKKYRTYQTVEFVYQQHPWCLSIGISSAVGTDPPWICLSGLDAHRKTLISWPHTVTLNQQKAKVYLQAFWIGNHEVVTRPHFDLIAPYWRELSPLCVGFY